MSAGIAAGRLAEERRAWRKDHPHGFVAKPRTAPDGATDLLTWDCLIPGRDGTPWAGASYACQLVFTADYPSVPPKCKFTPPLFHVNSYPSGTVCLSIINEDEWRPSVTLKQILQGVQEWFDTPNPLSPAHGDAYSLFTTQPEEYKKRILEQAKVHARLNST